MDESLARLWPIVAGPGTSQTLAWASSYCPIAVLAPAMARDTQSTVSWVFAGFASTIGWPLTAWGEASLCWRDSYLA